MSEKKGELLAAVYPNEEHAKTTLDMLVAMHKAVTITLIDAAMVTKDESGKMHVAETAELTTRKGAKARRDRRRCFRADLSAKSDRIGSGWRRRWRACRQIA